MKKKNKRNFQILLAFFVLILSIVGGVVYILGQVHRPPAPHVFTYVPTPSTTVSLSPLVIEKKSEDGLNKSYSLDMTYPQSSFTRYPEMFAFVQNAKKNFLDDFSAISDADAKAMQLKDRPYNFTVSTRIATSTNTASYIIEVYTFEGGAHGGTAVGTFTYDTYRKLVSLSRLFSKPYLTQVASLARPYFYATLSDNPHDMIDSGTAATSTNYSSWYVTDSTITFIFDQYQIGPYSIGIQEFPLQKSQVFEILSPEFR